MSEEIIMIDAYKGLIEEELEYYNALSPCDQFRLKESHDYRIKRLKQKLASIK